MTVIQGKNVPIKFWVNDIGKVESACIDQAKNLAALPFAFKHIAIMPDTHLGYGMPIGGVIATKHAIIPNAVGVDIGCGMKARATNLTVEEVAPVLKKIMRDIRDQIPLGRNHHKEKQVNEKLTLGSGRLLEYLPSNSDLYPEIENAKYQLGTLGGGNHFIELQKDDKGKVWIMLHSGSRNLGKKICDYFNRIAIENNARYYSDVPRELNFLPFNSREGQAYFEWMKYAMLFAEENRLHMLAKIYEILRRYFPKIEVEEAIDTHHNYAAMENHFGENVLVHRKGAVRARGLVIIPGTMGTKSYIAEGLENPESFCSCSHGAGRIMSRKAANDQFTPDDRHKQMGETLYYGGRDDVDEVPLAYKDIDEVMDNQKDLVKIKVELKPLAVVKG